MRHTAIAIVVLLAPGGGPVAAQETAVRDSLRSVQEQLRGAEPGSPAAESLRARMDSLMQAVVSVERARVDSLRVAVERGRAAAGPEPTDPLRGNPPFYGYTWVFYVTLALGALLAWLFAWWRRKDRGGLTGAAAVVSLIAGAICGAIVFVPVFMLNGLLSIAFNAMSPPLMLLLTAGALVSRI